LPYGTPADHIGRRNGAFHLKERRRGGGAAAQIVGGRRGDGADLWSRRGEKDVVGICDKGGGGRERGPSSFVGGGRGTRVDHYRRIRKGGGRNRRKKTEWLFLGGKE